MGEFTDRISELIEKTPDRVSGHVVVDQVYAHYQHEGLDFYHPDGGEPLYLKTPLYLGIKGWMRRLGRAAPHGALVSSMAENMEELSREVFKRAPVEWFDLANSGHPMVEADGELVYDRPPVTPRQTEAELREKNRLRYLFEPHRYVR